MAEIEAGLTLEDVFQSILTQYKSIVDENDCGEEKINEFLRLIEQCQKMVDQVSLFSRNEEIEEYSSSSIKFLFLEYFAAKVNAATNNLIFRRIKLLEAERGYRSFLQTCIRLHVLHEDDVAEFQETRVSMITGFITSFFPPRCLLCCLCWHNGRNFPLSSITTHICYD